MELPEEENTPEKRVDRIFAMMDKVSLGGKVWEPGPGPQQVGRTDPRDTGMFSAGREPSNVPIKRPEF